MARRATAMTADAKTPEPLVIIHMDKPTFETGLNQTLGITGFNTNNGAEPANTLCETDNGTVITATQGVEQALKGHIRRLVYQSPSVILDYGRSTRLFTGALRQAIQARDRTCRHRGCDLPARLCEIDHITEWQHGGHHHPHQRRHPLLLPPPTPQTPHIKFGPTPESLHDHG